ncbi:MAG: KilA-N domain-containing protein [Candidatus Izemoplasmatales bacterium]|nr:KilA-N domain-containing protein [Candidatus Izemoplasmatales bacterium]
MKELTLYNQEQAKLIANIHYEDEMISLTDLWKAAGSPSNKKVGDWLRSDTTEDFIEAMSIILKCGKSHLLKVKPGKGGGTISHKNIALAYAKWLDPKLHILVNQIFFERVEEEKYPEKIFERGIKTYERKGKPIEWIEARMQGIVARNSFTRTLSAHNVEREGYRNCTNATYSHLFGGSTAVIRHKKGIQKKQNIRDNLSVTELRAIELSELLAKENIENRNLYGNGPCEIACRQSSKAVANAIIQSRKPITNNI